MTWTRTPRPQRRTTPMPSPRWSRAARGSSLVARAGSAAVVDGECGGVLADLAQLAAQSMTPPVSCGITLHRDHDSLTVASSDSLAAAVDEVQYGQDDGPCLEAMRTGAMVRVPDVAIEHRWGSYPAHAVAHGVGSSLSLPLGAMSAR